MSRGRWRLIALIVVLGFFAYRAVAQVSAEYGVAAGGDIRDSTITIGLTPEQVERLIKASNEGLTTLYQTQVDDLSRKLDVNTEAIVAFFQILDENEVPLEKLPEKLAEIARRHRAQLDRLAVLDPEDPATRALVETARAAIETADYDRADRLLGKAEAAELAAARMAEELAQEAREAANRRRLKAAKIMAERGELSLTRLNYRAAAKHFREASKQVPPGNDQERNDYLSRYADALYRQGDEQGDNEALRQAIAVYQQLLSARPRERVPLDWAGTQNNLGIALASLGQREAGTAQLQAAVAAFREALKEVTRERVPLDWAMTQNNLGSALLRLGEREAGTAQLQAAVAAYREALKETTRERVPLAWAGTQNNLGSALLRLGEREAGTAQLQAAVAAFREALKERTRERVPLDWAATQTNLGLALLRLGEREAGTAQLQAAVAAYREALKERTRERVPLDWAATQTNLGIALFRLGERNRDIAQLRAAEAAISAAYDIYREVTSDYDAYFEDRLRELDQLIAKLS